MLENLRIKVVYDDFILKVKLTEDQIKILDMLLNKDKIVKIAMDMGMSERTVSNEIRKIKNLYNKYKEAELIKLLLITQ